MRTNWTDQNDQTFDPTLDNIFVHWYSTSNTPCTVFVSCVEGFKPSTLQRLLDLHRRETSAGRYHETIDFVQKDFIHHIHVAGPHAINRRRAKSFRNPCLLVHQRKNRCVGCLPTKVCVIEGISRVSASKSSGVSAIPVACLLHHQEVALRFTHFFSIDKNVAIAVVTLGPNFRFVFPYSRVIVERHRQVVWNKILCTHSKVHWIPIPELVLHFVQSFLGNFAVGRQLTLSIDVIKDALGQIRRINFFWRLFLVAIQVVGPLQNVRDCVICHVDCTVRQTLNHPRCIPWQIRPEPKLTRAGPFLQPPNDVFISRQRRCIVRVKVSAFQNMLSHGTGPRLFAIRQVPLVRGGDNAFVIRSRHNTRFGFKVKTSLTGIDHFLLDNGFRVAHFLSLVWTIRHDSNGETFQVGLILGLSKLLGVVGRFDFEFLAHVHSRRISISFNLDNGNDGEGHDHVIGNVVFGSKVGFVLQSLERHVIIWSVTGNRSDNTRSFAHTDCQQGKRVYLLICGQRSLERQSQQLISGECFEAFNLSKFFGEVIISTQHLARQTTCGTSTHDKDFVGGIDCVGSILAFRQHKTIGLTVHGFGTERGGDHVHRFVARCFQQGFHFGVPSLTVIRWKNL
mmetsp:Transcript_1653/g.3816  ORF Transcript_1653/g.3816 Transcript_1653/m.3816 type:complete len:622 (-) Transcript_1653:58-1923(-)